MKSTSNKLTGQPQGSNENLQEQISHRAYELYLERGEQRDANQNWLDAEKEILGAPVRPMSEQTQAASAGREG